MLTPDASHAAPEKPPRWRRVLRRVLQVLGGALALVLVLLLAVLLLLQTNWGAETAVRLVARQANPFTNATIRVGGVDGNWLQTLELRDVALVSSSGAATDTARFAHVDTLRLRYRLLPLLRSTLHLREVTIAGPSASLRQRADSSWTLPETAPAPAEPDTTPSAFGVRIDQIRLTNGQAQARFYAPGRDSTLRVTDLRLGARNVAYSSPLTGRLDTLGMRAVLPGIETPLQLQAAATLTEDRFTLAGLRLTSPHSQVQGAGTLRLPQSADDTLDDVDFSLTAAPLSFQDIAPFVPGAGLAPSEQLRLDMQARGSGRLLELGADARLSTGGTLTLDATATPTLPADVEATRPEPLRYRIDARARGLGTDLLTREAASAPTRVNADLQADLEGDALNQLAGTMALRLFDTQAAGYALDATRLQVSVADGQATLDGEGRFAGASFAVDGTVAPFAERPAYDLRADLADLNIGAFTESAEQESALNTRLQLAGEGFTPDAADLTARLDVLPSTLNRQRIEAGRLALRYARDTLAYDAQLAFAEGQLAAAGQARLAEPVTYTVDRGQIENVHVAALAGDTTASALNGTFRLQGRALAPETMQLDADLQLRDSHYGGYVLNSAASHATLRAGRLDLDLDADLAGGRFDLAAVARPFAEPLTLRTTRGRFQAVDIGVFLQDTTQHSDLNGTFQLSGRGMGERGTWDARLTLDSSRVNQQPIEAARLDATLDAGRLDAAMQLDAPSGHTRLAGYARPFDDVPTYALTEGTLSGLDLGALAGLPSARTALNGAFTLEGRGVDPQTLSLDMQLDLDASTLNAEQIEDGLLQAHIDGGEGTVEGRFALAQGQMTLQGAMRSQDERPSYRLRGQIAGVNAAALAGADSLASRLSADLDVEGAGFDPETLQLRGRLTVHDTRYAALRIDTLDAHAQMEDGLLHIDTLLARSNVATAEGSGQIALFDTDDAHTSDLRIEAQATNLAPLRPLLGAQQLSIDEGRFEGRVYGNPGTVRFDASTILTNLAYDGIRLADFEAQVAGARGDTSLFSVLEMRSRVGLLSYAAFTVEDTRFNARYARDTLDFTTSLTVDEERNARIDGIADLRPGQEQVTLETFDMRLGPDRWGLLQEASIAYGDAYRIHNLLLYSDEQQFAADGVVDVDGTQSLIVTLENVAIDAFTDLLGYEGLGGQLSGTLAMSGPAAAPQVTSTLDVEVRSSDTPVGDLRLHTDYDSLRADVDALLTHVDGSTLTVQGQVPVDLRLAAVDAADVMNDPVNLQLAAEAFSIGWIDPFLDPETVEALSGQLDAEATIGGTLDTPALSGSGTFRNGLLELTQLGTVYDRISADLNFTNEAVQVQGTAQSSGDGRLTTEGTINLTDLTLGAYDLSVETSDFLAIDTREYRVRVDSDLTIRGTTERPVVTGSAQVESADIYFMSDTQSGADLMPVELSAADQQIIERRFGVRLTEADTTTFDAYQAMAMDLNVQFQRDTWLRSRANPRMDIQFIGDLDVQKEQEQDAQVFGTIEVLPERSRVVQFGREFQIEEGDLTFNGPPAEPMMDIRAVYHVRSRGSAEDEAQITLAISGSPETLDLNLGSDPQMETDDVLCYLALSRPCAGFGGGSAAEGGQAERFAIGQAAGLIENLAATQLGLDVVRIEPTPQGELFLTAGQYLSPRFYAGVQQSISPSQPGAYVSSNVPDITLEYEFTRWLLGRTLYRNPELRLNLLWEYAY